MSFVIKRILGLFLLLVAAQGAFGFSMYGPVEPWQAGAIATRERWFYGQVLRAESSDLLISIIGIGEPAIDYGGTVDLGGSKNLGDEYRLNTSVITYAFDSSFLDYFGSNGVHAVDQAMQILNHLPQVSRASTDLSEFLTDDNQRINQRAQALNLVDLKSTVMSIMIERFGLSGETHIFDIHERIPYPGTCNFDYVTVVRSFNMRDFGSMSYDPSHYVNGTLYTYNIVDACPAEIADAVETAVDPTAFQFTAVATQEGLNYGGYYLGITRDDMDGLRYLYRRDNFNNELLPPNTFAQNASSVWASLNIFGTNTVATNSAALRGGIEKVNFVKVRYESTLGEGFKQATIRYNIPSRTNDVVRNQVVTRVITRPDIIFAAEDLTHGAWYSSYSRTTPPMYTVTNNVAIGRRGPGVLDPQAVISFNKVGPVYLNATTFFLNEVTATKGFLWGSFDGSTNDPIVYPSGTSLRDIETEALRPTTISNPGGVYSPPF